MLQHSKGSYIFTTWYMHFISQLLFIFSMKRLYDIDVTCVCMFYVLNFVHSVLVLRPNCIPEELGINKKLYAHQQ